MMTPLMSIIHIAFLLTKIIRAEVFRMHFRLCILRGTIIIFFFFKRLIRSAEIKKAFFKILYFFPNMEKIGLADP